MTKLTDGRKTVEIYMGTWDGNNWSPDFSQDFFSVGSLKMTEESAYIVPDVDYCVGEAKSWEDYSNPDYSGPEGKERDEENGIERRVDVN